MNISYGWVGITWNRGDKGTEIMDKLDSNKMQNVELACGHKTSVTVSDYSSLSSNPDGISKLICLELERKFLQCGHFLIAPCYQKSEFICREKIQKTLSCGHIHRKLVPCNANLFNVKCRQILTIQLPCGHQKETTCGKKEETIKCGCEKKIEIPFAKFVDKMEVTLPCSHKKLVPQCTDFLRADVLSRLICEELEIKKLPCGHSLEIECGQKTEERICSEMVQKILSCGHIYPVAVRCFMDTSNFLCSECLYRFKCGRWKNFKSENSASCEKKSKYKCKEVWKCMEHPKCGHELKILCKNKNKEIEDMICKTWVDKKFKCGHTQLSWCGIDSEIQNCGLCGECRAEDMVVLPCGHKDVKVRSKCKKLIFIKCSHQNGKLEKCHISRTKTCGRMCKENLICGHRCPLACHDLDWEDKHQDCDKMCRRKCPNGHKCVPKHPCKTQCQVFEGTGCQKLILQQFKCGHLTGNKVKCFKDDLLKLDIFCFKCDPNMNPKL